MKYEFTVEYEWDGRVLEFSVRLSGRLARTECPTCKYPMAWNYCDNADWRYITHDAGYSVEKYGRNPDEYREMEAKSHIENHFEHGVHGRRMHTELEA